MKSTYLILVVCVVVNLSSYTSGQNVDAEVATLLSRISATEQLVKNGLNQDDRFRSTIDAVAASSDFGIAIDPQIVKINKELRDRTFKRGIISCVQEKDNTISNLRTELQSIFKQNAIERIDALDNVGKKFEAELQTMQSSLSGTNLQNLKNRCSNNPNCEIRKQYPESIDNINTVTNRNVNGLVSLFNTVIKEEISPILPGKITTEVFNPVQQCITRVGI